MHALVQWTLSDCLWKICNVMFCLVQRIAVITTTLQYSLEGSFLSGLETGNTGMLRQCLRTYALIDKTGDAEALFRQYVVRPYMEQVMARCKALHFLIVLSFFFFINCSWLHHRTFEIRFNILEWFVLHNSVHFVCQKLFLTFLHIFIDYVTAF